MDRRRFLAHASWSAGTTFIPWGNNSPISQGAVEASSRLEFSPKKVRRRFAVATVHERASVAARDIFRAGGNAVDAAIAASFMLSVVDGHNSGIGGGCFALIRNPAGEFFALDGREQAGAAATKDMFLKNGQPQPEWSQIGPLAAGVPGQVAALERLSKQFGKLSWEMLVAPAIDAARNGFEMGRLANVVRSHAKELQRFEETKRILFPDGNLPTATTRLRQPDLGATLELIARDGAKAFYQGPIASAITDYLSRQGGILTNEDFASYNVIQRDPIHTKYRQTRVIGFPPPSSGGIHVAQMLGMLECFDLRSLWQREPATVYHLWLEVMQRAMADRAHWLGDADYAKVPLGLLDPGYLLARASEIQLGRANSVAGHGMPPGAEKQFFGEKHTTHLTTADSDGWVVAMTQTINTSFGNKMYVPGTGIVLNNEMDDFSIAPGVANAFGLIGAEANAIAPGKRPLSSMSPTIVINSKGEPMLTCGAAGGPRIITSTLQIICRVIDLGQDIAEALQAPRVHQQWRPAEAMVEEKLDTSLRTKLAGWGHTIATTSALATAQGIAWTNDGQLQAAADSRAGGIAITEPTA
ncbi:MAG: gamma-glutamyltransferase [Planctomycetaceae bacterium]|nr:gamma-glutamyltransferase [Planctomycetaceae bacterium]